MNLSERKTDIILGAMLALACAYFILGILPQWQSEAYRAKLTPEIIQELKPPERVQLERNAADIENSTRLTLAQIIGGLALLSGLYFTYQNVKTAQENLRITEEGKLTERFSKAVEMLGNEKLDVRLGGIYALERIARDSQKDHWTVMEVLTAFVRENTSYTPNQKESQKNKEVKLLEDIQATMKAIGNRKWSETEKERLNLTRVNLFRCVLIKANLSNTYLSGANLSEATFWGSNLSRTHLQDANLSKTQLQDADLTEAYLKNANLTNADLRGADLSGAKYLTLEQIVLAKNFEIAKLSPKLREELKEWQAKQAKENAGAGRDSSKKQVKK